MIETGEFEPITVDPIFENEPIRRQILITLGPNNLQAPKIKTLITWLMGRRYWKNQLNVQLIRQTHKDTPEWKIVLDKVINPTVWYPPVNTLTKSHLETEFIAKTKLKWNIFGDTKEVTLKIIPGSPFDFTNEMREHSILTTDDLPEATAQKYKYTLEIDLPPMTQNRIRFTSVWYNFLKYQFYHKLTTIVPTTPYHPTKCFVSVELLPLWEKMNIIVKTPREESFISSVPFHWNPFYSKNYRMILNNVPVWNWFGMDTKNTKNTMNTMDTMDTMDTPYDEMETNKNTVPYTTSSLTSNTCSLSPSKVITFDGVTLPLTSDYKHWLKGCTMVFVQDCGGSLFSIVGEGDPNNWEFKILMPNLEVRLISRESKMTTVINGEEKDIHIGDPCLLPPHSKERLYKIEKIGEGVIELKSFELGFTMTIDNNKKHSQFKVAPGSILHGQLCGICGNYNQDQSDEYNVPWDYRYESRDFFEVIKKSLIPSDTCKVSGDLKTFKDDICLKESHVTISRNEEGSELKCTSVKKLPQCSQNCRPQGYKTTKVCFTCSTTTPHSSITHPHKSYKPPTWDMFTEGEECEDFYQRMEIPTGCIPVY